MKYLHQQSKQKLSLQSFCIEQSMFLQILLPPENQKSKFPIECLLLYQEYQGSFTFGFQDKERARKENRLVQRYSLWGRKIKPTKNRNNHFEQLAVVTYCRRTTCTESGIEMLRTLQLPTGSAHQMLTLLYVIYIKGTQHIILNTN